MTIDLRARIARWLVRQASRIDRRTTVEYRIVHHMPLGWGSVKGGKTKRFGAYSPGSA
ncbi:hypothetical protein HZU38_05405 [Mycolicibacterium vanbaalenii]|uniref:hypothetical protein n=1 Tax=Mycolicibacterium vanbaalenii TaxID=110539 RepID=UPI001F3C8B79|nr:hypothetical protein [Mycolicibacterium vanbaalenii]UJL29938.1 hypothetical protein HZU38_05405 [Mycolicibacterium vanbaalenii]WND57000.1 hypothetical protein QQA43_00860 [Mycolicibacterium vanbaalenii]